MEWAFTKEMDYIEEHIRTLSSFPERARWLEDYFFQKLNQVEDLHLAMKLSQVVKLMKRDVLQGKRPDVNDYSGYSKMHTNRMFKDWFGLPPGKLLRYQQFNHAIQLIHQSDLSLTQVGLESGFYDQAHFIRVFEEFARMTPGHYKNNKTGLPGILPW
ncbi:MAG: AraC family transcriptional regulator [Saprospirales bacterium]|nr:AraC family transcriptional regulator [Saprospirales bacterium]